MTDSGIIHIRAWSIGEAIESGMDDKEAVDWAGRTAAAGGAAAGGLAAASATGLGGVGLAAGGTAVGISAVTAVAVPAVAVGALGYGVFKGIQGWGRKDAVKNLVKYFQDTEQLDMLDRIFVMEGKGQLVEGRRPVAWGSATATLRLLTEGRTSARVGLFCSPQGHFVLTYDLTEEHWAYAKLVDENDFTGGGVGPKGREFQLDGLNDMERLLRILKQQRILK